MSLGAINEDSVMKIKQNTTRTGYLYLLMLNYFYEEDFRRCDYLFKAEFLIESENIVLLR